MVYENHEIYFNSYYYSWMPWEMRLNCIAAGEYKELPSNVIPDDYTEYMCNGEKLQIYQ